MILERVLITILAAIFGGALGSFSNVLIIRWHADTPLTGRSNCPACRKPIKPRHLIPVFSWVMLKGRCAYCGKGIHIQYFLVEVAATLLGIIAALRWDPFMQPVFWFEFVVTVGLLVPVVMDLRWQELPVEYLWGMGIFGLVYNLLGYGTLGLETLGQRAVALACGMLFCGAFFGLQVVLSRGTWLGLGDFWFGLMMGAVLGWPLALAAVYLAYILGSCVALIGLVTGKFKRRSRLAFAPLLAAGTFCAIWLGPWILNWFHYAFS